MERVLNLITSLDRGGAETMIMNYYRHMDRSKVQFDFLVNREQIGAYEHEIQNLGGHIYRMGPMYPGQFGKYKKDFRSFLHAHPEYRIIHSHLEERSYFPLRIAKEEGVLVRISHAHNAYRGFNAKTVFRDYFRHRLPPYPTHKFACSDEAAIWLYGKDVWEHNEVKIINNAIDSDLYTFSQEKRNEMRMKLKADNTLILGNVGRLTNQKNQSFVIDILYYIKKLHADTKLLIIGEGELEHELKAHAVAKGVDRDVIFTGSVSNVNDYLQAMDAFVFPSLFEGLGISLVEAQAVGLPAFASDTITQSVNISGQVRFLPLKSGADYWASQILNHYQERYISQDMLRQHHYDIEREAKKLQHFYLEAVKHD